MENPATSETAIPVSAIDWTGPLELSDGTSIRLVADSEVGVVWGGTNPDAEGDYWIARADDQPIMGQRTWCFSPEGADDFIGLTVRNRAPEQVQA